MHQRNACFILFNDPTRLSCATRTKQSPKWVRRPQRCLALTIRGGGGVPLGQTLELSWQLAVHRLFATYKDHQAAALAHQAGGVPRRILCVQFHIFCVTCCYCYWSTLVLQKQGACGMGWCVGDSFGGDNAVSAPLLTIAATDAMASTPLQPWCMGAWILLSQTPHFSRSFLSHTSHIQVSSQIWVG